MRVTSNYVFSAYVLMHQQNVGKNYSIQIVNVLQMWLCSNILEQQIKFVIH